MEIIVLTTSSPFALKASLESEACQTITEWKQLVSCRCSHDSAMESCLLILANSGLTNQIPLGL